MTNVIQIKCLNNNISKEYPLGTSLNEIAKDMNIETQRPILGARVNNNIRELNYRVFNPKYIEFFDITNIDGLRMYQRSLSFVLIKAVKEICPNSQLRIEHSISKGFYCEIDKDSPLSPSEVLNIAEKMRQIIKKDVKFIRQQFPTEEVIKKFEANDFPEKAKLFKTSSSLFTSIYKLENQIDYFYGYLVPSTGYLKVFDLLPYYQGMLLRFPSQNEPEALGEIIEQSKLFDIVQEYKEWSEIINIPTIGSINEAVLNNKNGELIKVTEALHAKKVSQIADQIKKNNNIKIVLIAGPSSSGKTTLSKRLAVQLKVLGVNSLLVSLDDFFVDRNKTPKDENGEYDFESLFALNLNLFNSTMNKLIAGTETSIPSFDFHEGKNYIDENEKVVLPDNSVLIVEGIHGLNPKLTAQIENKYKFKIYVSALTTLGIDLHNRIPTTDNRLIRRIIRDYQYRGYSPQDTIKRWPSVRRGEDKNIFPFQEEADVMFNSALLYELGVLKRYIKPLLEKVPENAYEYSEAKRLLKFLSYFVEADNEDEIPPTSILREFLSGSSFKY